MPMLLPPPTKELRFRGCFDHPNGCWFFSFCHEKQVYGDDLTAPDDTEQQESNDEDTTTDDMPNMSFLDARDSNDQDSRIVTKESEISTQNNIWNTFLGIFFLKFLMDLLGNKQRVHQPKLKNGLEKEIEEETNGIAGSHVALTI